MDNNNNIPTEINEAPKGNSLLIAFNILVGISFVLGFCWFYAAAGINQWLAVVLAVISIALAVFYKIYRKNGRFKKVVVTLRILAVLCYCLMVFLPTAIPSFRNTKLMYPVKRAVYLANRGNPDYCLPAFLPSECTSYYFYTASPIHGPDSWAPYQDAELVFYTSQKNQDKLAEGFLSHDYVEMEVKFREQVSGENLSKDEEKYISLISWADEWLDDHGYGRLDRSERVFAKGRHICVLNSKTGLVFIGY